MSKLKHGDHMGWWASENMGWEAVIDHFGSAYKARLAIHRYSILGEESPLPENWNWGVLCVMYFNPSDPLGWMVAHGK